MPDSAIYSGDGQEYESRAHQILGVPITQSETDQVQSAAETAASRLKASVKPVEGRTEGLTTKVLDNIVPSQLASWGKLFETPGAVAKPNPYPPGSEESDAYENFRTQSINSYGPEAATELLGAGLAAAPLKPGLGLFGGRFSKTAVKTADTLEARGVSAQTVKELTGLERGADGMWRKEFSDKDSSFAYRKLTEKGSGPLSEFLDHPELYSIYPEARNIQITSKDLGPGVYGSMRPDMIMKKVDDSGTSVYRPGGGGEIFISNRLDNAFDPHQTVIHELQHWIQSKEGFEFGHQLNLNPEIVDDLKSHFIQKYNDKDLNKINSLIQDNKLDEARHLASKLLDKGDDYIYFNLVSEVEARNAQERFKMSSKDIRRSLAKDTEDAPRVDQIFAGYGFEQPQGLGAQY